MRKILAPFLFLLVLSQSNVGDCGIIQAIKIKSAVSNYNKVRDQVSLGDSKEKVLSILEPAQHILSASDKRPPESFSNNGKKIEIYYYRSGWTKDGLLTDDELTPYVFVNGKLDAIGWTALGGAKSHGQIVPQTHVNVNVHNNPYGY